MNSDAGSSRSGAERTETSAASKQPRGQSNAGGQATASASNAAPAAKRSDSAAQGKRPSPGGVPVQGEPTAQVDRTKGGKTAPRGTATGSGAGALQPTVSGPAIQSGSATEATSTSRNFLETLAQSLSAGTAASAGSPQAAPVASPAAGADEKGPHTQSNTIELALTSQSLAALLGLPAVDLQAAAVTRAAPSSEQTAAAAADPSAGSAKAATAAVIQDPSSLSLPVVDGKAASKNDAADAALATSQPATDATRTATTAVTTAFAQVDSSTVSAALASIATAGAFGAHPATPHALSDPNPATANLRAAVGTPAWTEELGGQLTWMAHQGLHSASLRLSPEHLGPLEVRISVREGDATVLFGAAQADTRAALEHALPRLREMFASQGMTLADAGVSREPPRESPRTPAVQVVAPIGSLSAVDTSAPSASRTTIGLVDTYA